MNNLLCPICQMPSNFEMRLPDGELHRCSYCSHCFYDTSTVDFEQYGKDYFCIDHPNWFTNPNLLLYRMIMNYMGDNPPNGSLIDIGCGNGSFLKWIRSQNNTMSLTGIDLSSNTPVDGIEFIQGDATSIQTIRKFDYVVSLAVIEHVKDAGSFVRALSSLCTPNGHIIIMTLNEDSILYQSARVLNKLGISTPYERLYSRHHIHHFNVKSLTELVRRNDLTIVDHRFHNIPIAAVDLPYKSALTRFFMRNGVLGTFILGSLMRQRTYLQTLICNSSNKSEIAHGKGKR